MLTHLFGDGEFAKPGDTFSFHHVFTFARGLRLAPDDGVRTSPPPTPSPSTSPSRCAVAARACSARNSYATAFFTGTNAAVVRANRFF